MLHNSFDVGMILPDRSEKNVSLIDNPISYFVTTKNWYVRTQSNDFQLPSLSQELYKNI